MLFVSGSDYFDVVERPMDLDTIRKWVEEAVYDRPVAARTPHEIVNAPSTLTSILVRLLVEAAHIPTIVGLRSTTTEKPTIGGVEIAILGRYDRCFRIYLRW